MATIECDVAIVGAGPGGSSLGSLLRKVRPSLDVHLFERETFPREHVGESLLPVVCHVLSEMGCWETVERAGFPIKIGATYRWGVDPGLWDFEFLPAEEYQETPRPGKFEGQRRRTAFQVDRATFDKILLDNAVERGCKLHQPCEVRGAAGSDGAIDSLALESGDSVRARWYVDASGSAGLLRRALGVEIDVPTALKNVAFWDYWSDAEWAVTIGTAATRILVLSLPYGWIWFIPVGPTRTSVGFVTPASHYKQSRQTPEDLYRQALNEEPRIRELLKNAKPEGPVRGTRDWSFVAKRMAGPNWFLVGEAAGFADPILSAGLTLTMSGAKELAYTIAELDRGKEDPEWLKSIFEENQSKRIRQHIQFADFWYSANGQFSDLKEYTRLIAKEAGLEMDANKAFQWLGTGGFTSDSQGVPGLGETSMRLVKQLTQRMTATPADWELNKVNVFRLKTDGVTPTDRASYLNGRVNRVRTLMRDGKSWPLVGLYAVVYDAISTAPTLDGVIQFVLRHYSARGVRDVRPVYGYAMEFLESLLLEGWIEGRLDPNQKMANAITVENSPFIHKNRDMS